MSLRARIALLVALVVLGAAAASVTAVRLVAERRFRSLVAESDLARAEAIAQVLAEYWRQQGSWEGVEQLVTAMSGPRSPMMATRQRGMRDMGRMAMVMNGGRVVLLDTEGVVVADNEGKLVGTRRPPTDAAEGVPVRSASRVVGSVFVGTMVDRALGPADSAFLASIARAIAASAAVAACAAMAVGLAVAGRISRPVRELTRAAERAAGGDLEVRVGTGAPGEIGRLAAAFNAMAGSLQRNEQMRRRLVADSAHELRTPASLIQGTVEAMLDGVYPADRTTLTGLHEEAVRLSRLVEELGELSLLDAGRLVLDRSPADLAELARAGAERFAAAAGEAGVRLEVAAEPDLPLAEVDAARIGQVLANLISNALRHTPRGGRVVVAAGRAEEGRLELRVEDSGPGIPEAERERVFQRYYRTDGARSSASGGRGLGLAIAEGIVRAHGGTIRAGAAALGGASLVVTLPVVAPRG